VNGSRAAASLPSAPCRSGVATTSVVGIEKGLSSLAPASPSPYRRWNPAIVDSLFEGVQTALKDAKVRTD
jgi:hypothetical protein